MKNYLNLTSIALAVFLSSQSAQAMDYGDEKPTSSYSTRQNLAESESEDDMYWEDWEKKKGSVGAAIKIGWALYQLWASQNNPCTQK